jgi:hypothetical protein
VILKRILNGEIIIKYSGDNVQNNNVFVDFENKKVVFEPVSQMTNTKIYLMNTASIFSAFLPLFLFVSWLLIYIQHSVFDKVIVLSATFIIIFTVPFIINLQMFDPSWRNKYYSRFMAGMISVCHLFNLDFRHLFGVKVKPNRLLGNVYIIPKFKNVALKYKLTGDFANNIKSINIKCLDGKGYNFYAVFTFNTPVQTGYMKLNYI